MGDQTVGNIHDLDQIHLVALRCLARIFPNQLPSVGKELSGAIPAAEFVSELAKSRLEKRPDLALSPQNPLCPIRQRYQDRRRFKYGVLCIERYQAIYWSFSVRLFPAIGRRCGGFARRCFRWPGLLINTPLQTLLGAAPSEPGATKIRG